MLSRQKKGHKKKVTKEKLKEKIPPLHTPEEEEEERRRTFMNFDLIWEIIGTRGRVAHLYRMESEHLWSTLNEEQQRAVFETIQRKVRLGRFVHYNPANAIRDNIPKQQQPQVLSYADYYRTFGTTEEQGGWKMENPTGQQVIYVKIN